MLLWFITMGFSVYLWLCHYDIQSLSSVCHYKHPGYTSTSPCHYDIPCLALISVWHYDIQTVNFMSPAFCVYINFSVSLWHSVCNGKFCITELSYITSTSGWHYDIWCVPLNSVSLTFCVYINISVSLWHSVCSGKFCVTDIPCITLSSMCHYDIQ